MKRIFQWITVLITLVVLPFPAQAAELKVAGKSAVLMDMATGTVLYESNSHERLAPASVTKVMTMLLIMEAVDSGKIAMSDTVTASETAAANRVSRGRKLLIEKLIDEMPAPSKKDKKKK